MTTVGDILTSTSDFITSMQNQASTAITALSNAAASWNAYSWQSISSPTLTSSDAVFGVDDNTLSTALATYKNALDSIVLPGTMPSPPDLSAYNTPQWDETAWSNLKTLLTAFTDNITGSDDVDTVVTKLTSDTTKLQVAMYAADRERKQQGLRDAYSAADSATGHAGFTFPNSMTTALKLSAQQQFLFDLSQVSRDLIIKLLDWAKANFQFSVDKVISAHQSDVDFNVRFASVLINSYEASIRGVIDTFREQIVALVSKLDADIKSYALRLDVFKANLAADSEYDRTKIMKYEQDVRQHQFDVQEGIQALASNSKNKIDAYAAAAQASATLAGSASQIVVGNVAG